MREHLLAALVALGACGGPALQNAPHPNTAMMAGGFAAAAAAVTLASPHDAAKRAEGDKVTPDTKPQTVKQQVPAGVFDRLDAQGSGSGAATPNDDDGTRGAPVIVPPLTP